MGKVEKVNPRSSSRFFHPNKGRRSENFWGPNLNTTTTESV